jgi:hypothetical protein
MGSSSYFVGDPTNVMTGEAVTHLLRAAKASLVEYQDGVIPVGGLNLWLVRLPEHDTAFEDQNGVGYSTDSGLFAVVPMEMIDEPSGEEFGTMLQSRVINISYMNGNLLVNDISIVFKDS